LFFQPAHQGLEIFQMATLTARKRADFVPLRHGGMMRRRAWFWNKVCAADDKIFRVDSWNSCDLRFFESRLRRDEEKLSRQQIRLEPLLMNAPG
jgi:hypothetical protein